MNSLKDVVRKITKIVGLTKAEMIDTIGPFAKSIIVRRTRAGFGVANRSKKRLTPLKPSTKVIRRKYKKLSPETSPETSNATETGEMLDTIQVKKRKNGISLKIKGTRKNLEKTKAYQEKRPFFDLTKEEETQVTNFVVKSLVKKLKRLC